MSRKDRFAGILAIIILMFLSAYALLRISIPNEALFFIMPSFQLISLAGILVFLILSSREILSNFKISKRTLIAISLIFIIGFALRIAVVPKIHRILYDEDIYLNIAQNIANEGRACMCDYGSAKECYYCIDNKEPSGWPTLVSIFYHFLGTSEGLGFTISIIFNSLTVLVIFGISYLLFENEAIAIFSSLSFSLLRTHIEWSSTVSADAISLLFAALSVFSMICYLKFNDWKTFGLLASAISFASQIRPESFLILIICPLFILSYWNLKKIWHRSLRWEHILLLMVVILMSFSNFKHMNNVSNDSWGAGAKENNSKFGMQFFSYNLKTNITYFFQNDRFPMIVTILAILGFVWMLISATDKAAPLALWWLSYFAIFVFFYAGSFDYGNDVRFALNLFPSISIFSGFALFKMDNSISKAIPKRADIIFYMLIALLVVLALPTMQGLSSRDKKSFDSMIAHDFIINQSMQLPNNSIIITHVPTYILINNNNAVQSQLIYNDFFVKDVLYRFDHIYFDDGFWCQHDKSQKEYICSYIYNKFNMSLVSSFRNDVNPNNYTYYFKKIK